jgi:hypothetical protein
MSFQSAQRNRSDEVRRRRKPSLSSCHNIRLSGSRHIFLLPHSVFTSGPEHNGNHSELTFFAQEPRFSLLFQFHSLCVPRSLLFFSFFCESIKSRNFSPLCCCAFFINLRFFFLPFNLRICDSSSGSFSGEGEEKVFFLHLSSSSTVPGARKVKKYTKKNSFAFEEGKNFFSLARANIFL